MLVHDPDLALAFYRDTLGLELRNDVSRGDFRWITVGVAASAGVAIVLTNYLNGSPADSDALAALIAKGALNGVHFLSDDLDAAFEKVSSAPNAEIVQEPTEQFWGTRDFAVRDPSGNLIRIDRAAGNCSPETVGAIVVDLRWGRPSLPAEASLRLRHRPRRILEPLLVGHLTNDQFATGDRVADLLEFLLALFLGPLTGRLH